MNARYGDNNMIKEYQNGSDFILENSSFLDQNKYMSVLFYLDNNDLFARHSWYFRNALVRANYKNAKKGIDYTPIYLERFFHH